MSGNSLVSSPQPSEWVKGNAVGAGSFGIANIAVNKSNGELFVVKSSLSGVGLESLENEANILENLKSPYIVKCLGRDFSNEANGERKLNLFLEFMAGGNLSDVMAKSGRSLDEGEIRFYIKQILQGLKYLHKRGIVHSDLKCKNLLLDSSGNIKLADFGGAKKLKTSQAEEQQCLKNSWQTVSGTPLWMAPEVLRNEDLDFASDIWSLGCTLIEMATGKPPWGEEVSDPMAAVFKIAFTNDMPQSPTKFSRAGLDFLAKCLHRDPKMRWTSEKLLNHPFVSLNFARSSSKKDICSPESILDFVAHVDDSDSDESESVNREETARRIPSSTGCSNGRIPFSTRSSKRKETMIRKRWSANDLSEDWITVRSS